MKELVRVISKKRDESDSPGGHSAQIPDSESKAVAIASSEMLKLARCPLSLAATLCSFTFYVAHPIRSIREQAGYNE
jgi:hypothetical protein